VTDLRTGTAGVFVSPSGSALSGSLTVGTGPAPGTPLSVLNIGLGDTLTMGTKPVTLNGGSITGPGTLSETSGAISGYGTISSQITGTTLNANSTDGTAFGGFSPFINGTPGTALTLIGQNNLASDSFGISAHGTFDFQGVTITAPTLTGVSTNLNAGSGGGNNYYGLLSFTGAASTLIGNVNNTNYETLAVTGTTLHLNGVTMTNIMGYPPALPGRFRQRDQVFRSKPVFAGCQRLGIGPL
jgi:hypothetical protein